MILIQQRQNIKVPGTSSLFITFNYNKFLVDSIHDICKTRQYNSKTKEWEVPVIYLAELLDVFVFYDEIRLEVFPANESMDENPKLELQSSYKTAPFPYQIDGIKYGLSHDRWLLLDPPGLGKTLNMIYLAEELKAQRGLKHCVIICGINTLKENWKNEIEKHSNESCRILGRKIKSNGTIAYATISERAKELASDINEFFIITNIETLRDDDVIKALKTQEKGVNKYDMLVIDEVHKCKSPSSIAGSHILKLTNATYRIGLTGTLLLNSPLDAYIPLKWIGSEHCNFSTYKYFYCVYGGQFGYILTGFQNTKMLKKQIESVSLRRSKDLLHLPPKIINKEFIELDDNQRLFYEQIKNGIKQQVDKVNLDQASVLAMVTRLRQATACPSVLSTNDISAVKLDRAADLVEEIVSNGEKVVIFSVFKETIYRLLDLLKPYNPLMLTGDLNEQQTAENINLFQTNPNNKVILGTIAKMGTGITLTAANYEIFIDSAWTQGIEEQCEDRCWRIGTNKNVIIYKLICNDTIDTRVDDIISLKGAVSDYIIDDKLSDSTIDNLRNYIQDL